MWNYQGESEAEAKLDGGGEKLGRAVGFNYQN